MGHEFQDSKKLQGGALILTTTYSQLRKKHWVHVYGKKIDNVLLTKTFLWYNRSDIMGGGIIVYMYDPAGP